MREPATSLVGALVEALASGAVEITDLTQPLNERTPVIRLPEQFVDTPGLKRHEISRYDERGPAWAWDWLEIGEHVGTHFDAPIHWITGREGRDVSQVPPHHLVAPAVVIDKSAESERNPDYLLTVGDARAFEAEHGPLPEGGCSSARAGTLALTTRSSSSTTGPTPASTPSAPAGSPRRARSSASVWRPSASTLVRLLALIRLSRSTTTSSVRESTALRSSRTLHRYRRPVRCSWWRR